MCPSDTETVPLYTTGLSTLRHVAPAPDKYFLVWMINCMCQKPKRSESSLDFQPQGLKPGHSRKQISTSTKKSNSPCSFPHSVSFAKYSHLWHDTRPCGFQTPRGCPSLVAQHKLLLLVLFNMFLNCLDEDTAAILLSLEKDKACRDRQLRESKWSSLKITL